MFVKGRLVDVYSTMAILVALSSTEAEYMGACNAGVMFCYLWDLRYDFEQLSLSMFDINSTIQIFK